jgi:hypothetical protein
MVLVAVASIVTIGFLLVTNPRLAVISGAIGLVLGIVAIAISLGWGLAVVGAALAAYLVVSAVFLGSRKVYCRAEYRLERQVTARYRGTLRLDGDKVVGSHEYQIPADLVGAESPPTGWITTHLVDGMPVIRCDDEQTIALQRWPLVSSVSVDLPPVAVGDKLVICGAGSVVSIDCPRNAILRTSPPGTEEASMIGRTNWLVPLEGGLGWRPTLRMEVRSPLARTQFVQPLMNFSYARVAPWLVGGVAGFALPLALKLILGLQTT